MAIIQAIVFDLDDTLYSECEYVCSGMDAVAAWVHRQFGNEIAVTKTELMELVNRNGSGRVFNSWLQQNGLNEDVWVMEMVNIYRSHSPSVSLHVGVAELLNRLRNSFRLGMVTDGYLITQKCKVAALSIRQWIDEIVFSDELGREYWKPNTRPYEEVLRRLQVKANRSVYIGDNPAKDFRGARELGMRTIRVRYSDSLRFHDEPATALDGPDLEIPDLLQLEDTLQTL